MKVVINTCFGRFGLSNDALNELKKLQDNQNKSWINIYEIDRFDPDLVKVVETLGVLANGGFAKLKVVEIPDDVIWTIEAYDGYESIHEQHRIWE